MKIHGYVDFEWSNDVLVVKGYGPFNLEAVEKAERQYTEAINSRKVRCYGVLEIWDEDSLGSPEVMSRISDFWYELSSKKCNKLAILVTNQFQQKICEKLLPKLGRVFLDQSEAESWLSSGSE